MRKRVFMFALLFLAVWPVAAQTVLQRTRLGHVVEDLDAFEKRLVALDGQEVFVADAKGRFEKLFDVRAGGADHGTGIVYVPTEKTYLVVSPATLFQFFVFDEKGAFLGTRAITYLGGFTPAHIEAGTYLGKDTPYPDHIAFLAYGPVSTPFLEVAKRDGTVVAHIALPPVFLDNTFGMAASAGSFVYVLSAINEIYKVDFTGQIVGGPVKVHEGYASEGITTIGDRIYIRDYFSGKFVALDTNLQRQPADDVRHDFGLDIGQLFAVTWNSDASRFLILSPNADQNLQQVGWDIVVSLDEKRPRLYPRAHGYLRARGLSWMPDEGKIATAHPQPQRRILIYSPEGELLEQIDVTPIGRPNQVAWAPSTQEFFVRVIEMPAHIRVLSRTGTFVRDIDLSTLGPAVGAFTEVGGELLVFVGGLLYRTDLNGVPITSYDYSSWNILPASIAAISTGPLAGKFAVAAARNTELLVVSLP